MTSRKKWDTSCGEQDASREKRVLSHLVFINQILRNETCFDSRFSRQCTFWAVLYMLFLTCIVWLTPQIHHLFSGPLESCCSKLLSENGKGLRAMLLTLVGLKVSGELRHCCYVVTLLILLLCLCRSKLHTCRHFISESHTFFWQICTTTEELAQFMQNTLLSVQSESKLDINAQMQASLDSLQKLGHVHISEPTESRKIEVTHLGQATFKGLTEWKW